MPARPEQFVNDQAGTLNGAITAGATSLVIDSATGWPSSGDFRVEIGTELILVTKVSGTTWTIERGIEGTTGASASSGAAVTAKVTGAAIARMVRDMYPWTYPVPYRLQDINGDPLTSSDFTLYDPGTRNAILDDAPCGGIRITKDDQGATDNVSLAVRPALSTPYSVVMAFTHEMYGVSGQVGPHMGGAFFQSTGENILAAYLAPCYRAGYRALSHTSMTSGSTLHRNQEPFPTTQPQWMKLEDDGVDLKIYWSPTGGPQWEEFYTRARGSTPFTTGPTEIGFCCNNFRGYVAQGRQSITLVAWYEA